MNIFFFFLFSRTVRTFDVDFSRRRRHTELKNEAERRGVHAVAPGLLYVPAVHALQLGALGGANWPAVQAEQTLAPALEKEPAAHAKQLASETEPALVP